MFQFLTFFCVTDESNNNPLPLPPKTTRLNLSAPPKRHVRKNPLIIPSGMAANLLSRRGEDEDDSLQQEVRVVTTHFSIDFHSKFRYLLCCADKRSPDYETVSVSSLG